MAIKDFVKKLQNLPLKQRKNILWIIVSIFVILFLFLFFQNTKKRWSEIQPLSILPLAEEFQRTPEEETEELGSLGEENSFSFEMTPEMKKDLEKLLEDALKALRESE